MERHKTQSILVIILLITATCAALAMANKPGLHGDKPVAVPTRPAGDEVVSFSGQLDRSKIVRHGNGTVTLSLTMTAADLPNTDSNRNEPVDLMVILDRSGSMQGEKIDSARQAIIDLVSQLSPEDRLALISYSTDVTLHAGLLPATPQNRERLIRTVAEIQASGGTNIEAGLQQGLDILNTREARRGRTRLILISDGLANHGITDPHDLGIMATRAVTQEAAISTVGVGLDFNERLMTTIADQGAGSYTFLETADGFATAFARELHISRTALATGLEISIPLSSGIRLLDGAGYPVEYRKNTALIRPGDLLTGQSRKLYLTLQVPTDREREFALTSVSLAYRRGNVAHRLSLGETLKIACVAQKKDALASINKNEWEGKVLQEDFSLLREKVADAIRRGNATEAGQEIETYRKEKEEVNAVVGSAAVRDNLGKDLDELTRQIADSFAGPPAAAAEKQKKYSKSLQYEAYESRRDKK